MHPLIPTKSHILLLLVVTMMLSMHGSSSSSANEYNDCGNLFECGSIRVGYPFWGAMRPKHCDHPDFQLTCPAANVTLLSISSEDYRVLKIDEDAGTMDAVRNEYRTDVCLDGQTQPKNTTLQQSGLFTNNSDTEDLRLFYSCNSQLGATLPNHFNCSSSINYYFTQAQIASQGSLPTGSNVIEILLGSCAQNVLVPIFKAQATILQSVTMTALPITDVITVVSTGFRSSWNATIKAQCDRCLTQNSTNRCAFNTTSNEFTCYQALGGSRESSPNRNLIVGISAAVVGLLIIFAIFLSIYKREAIIFWNKEKTEEFDVEAFIRNYTSFAPKRYTHSHVKKMTNSFTNVIGKGGFGCVYKGTLPDGRLVAVKVLKESKHNGEDFINEVASMGRTSHVNIVTLVGFSYERNKRALIYDFMSNGSLDKFIFNQEDGNTTRCLNWKTLYEIALGVARGLEYLHRGCNTRILHFDIKPQNILLDKDFCPKISDFGLAKLWLNKESNVSMMGARGTAGYIAPEVFSRNFGGVSHKSDVYSYGMLVLEMVGGRRNNDPRVSHTSEIYFPFWIYEDVDLGKDLRVLGVTTEEEKEIARKMLLVSFWCIQTNPSDRPPMSKVVDMLEGDLQHVQIPPKPFLFSPERSPQQSTESS
ncbi:LEAF RUST 10 DISEASE-RESISTANCE LOCUS RECEPTOR-LIKE PROTEIN KINASE-like 2.5 [Ziziphus jujuba]|uniref:non-specific serine/threonine protein kinase n=1 Tax=Ziziphus jujuba TaxID=326968 RepID=A0ABM4A5T1_ZIZJJ|nr:LEAF RUST 10 DISEASE-RESISTANCE LOCUS RECEPTOR-LIKE PROTEIN KINASE-like 2.5 [Ziziphus jujuba]XP_060672081.1 LEAF RUST 10 DISEASE-RESISTANCE LOCUS RECEPTOR-LIKE PROTEIN KINASE-like 2.5 [Ziziphus jujuba]